MKQALIKNGSNNNSYGKQQFVNNDDLTIK